MLRVASSGGRSARAAHRDSATSEQVGVDAANRLVNIDGATAIVAHWAAASPSPRRRALRFQTEW